MSSTLRVVNIKGVSVLVPNAVDNSPKGYYISYNNYDRGLYGGHDTTAIVIDHSGAFLILNGDHRENLKGFTLNQACEYFHKNSDKKNLRSDNHQDDCLAIVDGIRYKLFANLKRVKI